MPEVEFRSDKPPEEIKNFHAYKGVCHYCQLKMGVKTVVMHRHPDTLKLLPNSCWCLSCGQKYYINTDDIDAWDNNQWEQKKEEEDLK